MYGPNPCDEAAYPCTGNQPSRSANTYARMYPSTKTGSEKPSTANAETARSNQLPCREAATTPKGTARDMEMISVRPITDRVAGIRCTIMEATDCPENKELPRSP